MGRLLKIILSTLAILILLIVVAAVALPFFFDPNDFKPEIQTAVKEHTGRDLTIAGDLELSVFPWLGISTGELNLSNAAAFPNTTFVKIGGSQVKVKLLPLLSKKLEVSRIELKGLDLYLAKNKQGVSNWDDLIKPKEPEATPQPSDEAEEDVNPLAALALGGISIEQAHIIWDDQQTAQHFEVNDFNFKTGALHFDEPIDIDLSLQLNSREPSLKEALSLSTRLVINEGLNRIKLSNVDLKSLTTGSVVPGETLTAHLQSAIDIDLTQQTVAINGLKLNLSDVTEDKLKIALTTDANIKLSDQNITLKGLNVTVDGLLQNKLNAHLTTDVKTNLTQQTLLLSGLTLKAGEIDLSAEISGSQIKDNPTFKGPITVAPFNLAAFLKTLDIALPEMKGKTALNELSAAFNLLATTDSVDIQNLVLKLDQSQITGSASVKHFAQPASAFKINVDAIDVSNYLAPEPEGKKPKIVTPAAAAVAGVQLFPVETLKALNVNGELTVGDLTMNQLNMKGIKFNIKADKGVINTQQSIKQLYEGRYSGKSSVSVQQSLPILSLNETLSNIQVGPLLKAMQVEREMTGVVNANVNVKGRGNTAEAIKSSLTGNLNFSFNDSLIKGFNLQKIIDGARLLIEGRGLPAENKNDQTVFSVIKGSAVIKNGLLSNEDLLAESSKVKVVGKGTANIGTGVLDYAIDARLLKSGEKGKIKGIPLAVKIGGTFDKPEYMPDIETMLKAKYGDKVNKVIDKNKDKIIKKLDEKLGKGVGKALDGVLKGFF